MPDTTNPKPEAATHTPGPWLYGQNNAQMRCGGSQWEIGLGRGADLGVSGTLGTRGSDYMLVSGVCREADARLIAAAPDLLAQLQGWAALMDPASPDYDPAFAPGLDAIRAAIAKAEGR
jgi:hypothetical protein